MIWYRANQSQTKWCTFWTLIDWCGILFFFKLSLVPNPCAAPAERQSGEQRQISWAYSPKVVRTNEIARLAIITKHFPYNSKTFCLYSSIRTFFEQVWYKMFWTLLGDTVAKVCASPRNSTWSTRPFLLRRGWGLWTRLYQTYDRNAAVGLW